MADFPAELVESMTQAIGEALAEAFARLNSGETDVELNCARAALSALPASARAVIRGEAVAVPREPTAAMLRAAAKVDDDAYIHGSQHGADDEQIYYAMLAASPYAEEPQR